MSAEVLMLALFRKKPVALDPAVARFILDHHDNALDVHERAALYAARVAEGQPREGSHGAKVLQIWENTANEDGRALVADGVGACERTLAERIVARKGRSFAIGRCTRCEGLVPSISATCVCGGKARRVRLR